MIDHMETEVLRIDMTAASNSKFSRREFVAGAAGIALATQYDGLAATVQSERPNILFILADDMGWGDLSCYGRPDYKTPNLDRLASEGVKFTNAYSAAPVCTPTRVGFMTGRYPARLPVGMEEPIHERSELGEKIKLIGIPHEHPTVASIIKSAGYNTALIGKWHLGYLPYFGPLKSGFDEFFGNMSGAVDHFTHKDMTENLDLFEDEVPVEKIGYMTDLLTERAIEYLHGDTQSHSILACTTLLRIGRGKARKTKRLAMQLNTVRPDFAPAVR